MITYIKRKHSTLTYRIFSAFIVITFIFSSIVPPRIAQAQTILNLPIPGTMVPLSPAYIPTMIKGIMIDPANPLQFDFIIDTGDANLDGDEFNDEATKLIKYFLASLTLKEEEMWVNLSPYEKNRIIPPSFGQTEMGRDLLVQDYLLKQLTASLIYPEDELGKAFWDRVYSKAQAQFGTTEIPMNTFNKVWIVPESANVFEHEKGAFVVNSHLKVMLEEDYLALESNVGNAKHGLGDVKKEDMDVISGVSSEIVREILIPEIEKEVNEGETFANLRQIFNSMILATWYKQNLKESLLGQVYVDQNKVKGVELNDTAVNQQIYDQYVEAFEKGVYNYIKEDYDPATKQIIPRKYFSGGFASSPLNQVVDAGTTAASPVNPKELVEDGKVVSIKLNPLGEGANQFVRRLSKYEVYEVEIASSPIKHEVFLPELPSISDMEDVLTQENVPIFYVSPGDMAYGIFLIHEDRQEYIQLVRSGHDFTEKEKESWKQRKGTMIAGVSRTDDLYVVAVEMKLGTELEIVVDELVRLFGTPHNSSVKIERIRKVVIIENEIESRQRALMEETFHILEGDHSNNSLYYREVFNDVLQLMFYPEDSLDKFTSDYTQWNTKTKRALRKKYLEGLSQNNPNINFGIRRIMEFISDDLKNEVDLVIDGETIALDEILFGPLAGEEKMYSGMLVREYITRFLRHERFSQYDPLFPSWQPSLKATPSKNSVPESGDSASSPVDDSEGNGDEGDSTMLGDVETIHAVFNRMMLKLETEKHHYYGNKRDHVGGILMEAYGLSILPYKTEMQPYLDRISQEGYYYRKYYSTVLIKALDNGVITQESELRRHLQKLEEMFKERYRDIDENHYYEAVVSKAMEKRRNRLTPERSSY